MSGWGGLLMKAASGALKGEMEGEDFKRKKAEDDEAKREHDASFMLSLIKQPGIVLGDQPAEGTPLPKQPEGMPTSMRAVAPKPKSLISVGSAVLGGKDTKIGFDPDYTPAKLGEAAKHEKDFEAGVERDRKGQESQQAFQLLHKEDPDAYPMFVDGFDYPKEVSAFLDDKRAEHVATIKAKADSDLRGSEKAEKAAIKAAETRAFNLLADGANVITVGKQPGIREHLAPQDIVRLKHEADSAGKGVDREGQMEDRLAQLTAAGIPDARAKVIANDPVLYRTWEKNRMGGDAVGDMLGDELSTPSGGGAPPKPGLGARAVAGVKKLFGGAAEGAPNEPEPDADTDDAAHGPHRTLGRDQKSMEDRARELIEQHPDASDEEIARMLQGM